ncbi:MAG TPA: hypothetical protein ENL16_03485 [Candidatus Woesearchaeota archaeon]|nr:hypothetical protein [Candidatus Woesearchaeota archaeon]
MRRISKPGLTAIILASWVMQGSYLISFLPQHGSYSQPQRMVVEEVISKKQEKVAKQSQRQAQQQPTQILREESARYFPLRHKGEWYLIPIDRVYKKTIKAGESVALWWWREGKESKDIDLAKLIFLAVNEKKYYPQNFSADRISEYDIRLIKGEQANFVDLNKDGRILGERGEPLSQRAVLDILALKNNKGELCVK